MEFDNNRRSIVTVLVSVAVESVSPISLVIILVVAVAAPVAAELIRKRLWIPSVLFEIFLGILIGPQLLGWAEVTPFVDDLSTVGLAFLMFMAGYELDLKRERGAPLNLAMVTWGLSLALGLVIGGAFMITGFVISDLLIGLALTTTAIGTLLPMLRDQDLIRGRFGMFILAGGSVGEFGPIVAITLLLSTSRPAREAVLLVAFVLVALGVAYFATRTQPPRLVEVMQRHLTTSTQLPVRIVVLLVVAMTYLAFELGLDTLLGAFSAGMILRLALSEEEAKGLNPKIEALSFGFFVPVFFVVSGMEFDLDALAEPSAFLRVPLYLGLFLVVRGLPVLLVYRGILPAKQRWAMGFLQATALPLVVVITGIGLDTGRMKPDNAAALVGAAMLSVLIYPLIGIGMARRNGAVEPGPEPEIEADDRL